MVRPRTRTRALTEPIHGATGSLRSPDVASLRFEVAEEGVCPEGRSDQWKEPGMLDVLMVALTIVAFGAFFALISGLERV